MLFLKGTSHNHRTFRSVKCWSSLILLPVTLACVLGSWHSPCTLRSLLTLPSLPRFHNKFVMSWKPTWSWSMSGLLKFCVFFVENSFPLFRNLSFVTHWFCTLGQNVTVKTENKADLPKNQWIFDESEPQKDYQQFNFIDLHSKAEDLLWSPISCEAICSFGRQKITTKHFPLLFELQNLKKRFPQRLDLKQSWQCWRTEARAVWALAQHTSSPGRFLWVRSSEWSDRGFVSCWWKQALVVWTNPCFCCDEWRWFDCHVFAWYFLLKKKHLVGSNETRHHPCFWSGRCCAGLEMSFHTRIF